jgi:hypothetical protein
MRDGLIAARIQAELWRAYDITRQHGGTADQRRSVWRALRLFRSVCPAPAEDAAAPPR